MRKIDLSDFQVATSETARDINRRIVLNLIRTRQPISRADIARLSGLQRSTVSLITEQLIAEHWVTEGAVGRLPRGRRPRFLHLNVERGRILCVDIRPGRTGIAMADLNGRFVVQESMKTLSDPLRFLEALAEHLRKYPQQYPDATFEGVAISVPGRVDQTTGRLAFAPNLGWRDLDIIGILEPAVQMPVVVENVCNACALAEIWFGRHGEDVRDLVTLTVSEGVGTGIICNGQLIRGPRGLAGEFGHVSVSDDGPVCNCGAQGCWEMFASNRAAVRFYTESLNGKASVNGIEPSFEDLLRLAEAGDSNAIKALELMAYHLGAGMDMLIKGLAPKVIVIVGEITRVWPLVGDIIVKAAASRIQTPMDTKIVPTDDPIQPRLRGAAALILQRHFAAPVVA